MLPEAVISAVGVRQVNKLVVTFTASVGPIMFCIMVTGTLVSQPVMLSLTTTVHVPGILTVGVEFVPNKVGKAGSKVEEEGLNRV